MPIYLWNGWAFIFLWDLYFLSIFRCLLTSQVEWAPCPMQVLIQCQVFTSSQFRCQIMETIPVNPQDCTRWQMKENSIWNVCREPCSSLMALSLAVPLTLTIISIMIILLSQATPHLQQISKLKIFKEFK